MNAIQPAAGNAAPLRDVYDKQRTAYLAAPVPSREERRQDLLSLKRMLMENREAIIEAITVSYTHLTLPTIYSV